MSVGETSLLTLQTRLTAFQLLLRQMSLQIKRKIQAGRKKSFQHSLASQSERARRKPPFFRGAERECEDGESQSCPFILTVEPLWMITKPNDNDDDCNGEAAADDDDNDDEVR